MIIRRKINGVEYPILLTPEELKLAHEIYVHREYVIYYKDVLTNKDNPEYINEKEFNKAFKISKEYILNNIEEFVNVVLKKIEEIKNIEEKKEKFDFNNEFIKSYFFMKYLMN